MHYSTFVLASMQGEIRLWSSGWFKHYAHYRRGRRWVV